MIRAYWTFVLFLSCLLGTIMYLGRGARRVYPVVYCDGNRFENVQIIAWPVLDRRGNYRAPVRFRDEKSVLVTAVSCIAYGEPVVMTRPEEKDATK